LREHIHELVVCGVVSAFRFGLVHFGFTSPEGAVVVLLFPLPTGDEQRRLTKEFENKQKNLQPVVSRLETVR